MESVSTGRRLNPRSESIDHFRTCREDFGIERNQSFKGDQGNAQFSLCCTSTAMPDDDSQDRHPAFCFAERTNQETRNAGKGLEKRLSSTGGTGSVACAIGLVRRSSLFPMFSHHQVRRIVPSAPILARYLARHSALEPRVLCTVPDHRTRRGCH